MNELNEKIEIEFQLKPSGNKLLELFAGSRSVGKAAEMMGYNVFKDLLEEEMNATGIKKLKPKVIYSKKRQTGKRIDIKADKKRTAMPSGKRKSKSGKIYYEYRKNRTDDPLTNV